MWRMNTVDRSAAPSASMSCLAELPPEWQPVQHAILADGSLAVLATDVDLAGEHRRIGVAWQAQTELNPPSRLHELAAAGRARICTMTSTGAWSEGPTFALETPYPKLDRFVDGRWLVVDPRSRETNTRVLSPEGAVLDRFRLGIGVEHLAIDGNRIWVGWDDQSVFSTDDLQVSGQEVAHFAHAVFCFADDGTPSFLPAWPEHGGCVIDPYALSVDGIGAWSCPYMAALDYFPLIRFVPGEPARWWRNDVNGSAALATQGDHVLLAGGWEADRLALLSLPGDGAGEQAALLGTWSLPLRRCPAGSPREWEHPSLLVGRGDTIHLVQDQVWYRWRVSDLARS